MKKIIITSPEPVSGEVFTLCRLLNAGVFAIHLRRPHYGIDEYRRILDGIPLCYHGRIVLHDYFSLAVDYDVKGIHLNSRNHNIPEGYNGSISCSCHSLEEVELQKPKMDYVFLSPVFDSISKIGYHSAFTLAELTKAASDGIIDSKVFALGGVTVSAIPQLEKLSFGGIALMGDIWK
jgi:thiamine-phosphate pyrophosphorylase